jgi:hypothetical protein
MLKQRLQTKKHGIIKVVIWPDYYWNLRRDIQVFMYIEKIKIKQLNGKDI